jgi:nardilysin
VGSFSDPKNIPGMAHFLEHMVFMGSEKFPQENDFDSFISKRGGSDNASTDCEVTTFYFECLEKDLFTALDKFAQFFISPLMKRTSISREMEAIESEFQIALPSDTFRKEQLLVSFAKTDTPVNTFTWGNLITLRDNVSEDELYAGVHEFRKRHYSAHRMTLTIQARLSLDLLQTYVLECFHNVPSNDLPPDDFTPFVNVFDTPEFPKLYYVQPVKEGVQV